MVAGLLVTAAIGAAADTPPPVAKTVKVDFTRDVRPILSGICFKCHGPDEGARKAKLRLDVREEALKPAKSGEVAIIPGKPDKSELVRRVFAENEDDLMPPVAAKHPLTSEQKDILKRWIAEGAEYQPHWAFVPPRQPPLPQVRDPAWPRNAIDTFVLARLEKAGLKPTPRADKYTLVRRLYLDLIGLPPTPAEADAFVNNSAPGAYEQLVDQLLASPHYGERWTRRWLDLARYADTNGYEKDNPRSIWPWRDWVINALNADMPFNEFTIEQLAGDLLPNATPDQIIATGFHRNTMINEEGGIDPLEFRFYSSVDRVHVTATAWLGLTMACAQCHTHKFDPIQHSEYYQFMALLDNADEPTIDVVPPEAVAKRKKIEAEVAALEAALPDKFPVELRIEWRTPGAAEFASQNGAAAEFLSDGSFRLDGKSPDKDVYTIKFTAPAQRITHLELEAIPDETIGKGGPGRTDHGNFVLSELEMEVKAPGVKGKPRKIKFASATADFSQDGYPVQNAIDGNPDTGWAIAGPNGAHQHRHAVLALAEPLDIKNKAAVTVRLTQNFGSHHTLGRFRISLGNELPEKNSNQERRREMRDQKFAKWAEAEARMAVNWQPLHPVAATSTSPFLTVQDDDSIFAAGDFRKTDIYTVKFRDLPAGVKAIRLEMLADDRLPNHGPGAVSYEGPKGDFWLADLKIQADGKPVALTNATQDFAAGANIAAKMLDADQQSGWSINGGQGKNHNAVIQFAGTNGPIGELAVVMTTEKYYAAGLGRFRIWVTTDDNASASTLENESLALLVKYRDPEKLKSLLAATNAPADREALLRQFAKVAPELAGARRAIDKVRGEIPVPPTTLVMRERPAGHERPTFVHHRGEFLQPREQVTPGVPSFLPPLPDSAPKNRLALAKWLVSGNNPLTGRVVMNRQWEAFFGRGIVRTVQDFGFQGELPSHPDLLDWLAVEFVKEGWSRKKMHKLIVMSATYQQASGATEELRERDPENLLLARGPRFRLDAELVRDEALVASGLFTGKIGGPSVFPPQPPGVTSEGSYGALKWEASTGPDRYRRGLYTYAKRTAPFAMTATFDAPSGEACLARRERSNSPLQALTLLNDTMFMECARALGRLAADAPGDDAARVELLFRRCLTRPPTPTEREKLTQFYQTQLARFAAGELSAAELLETKAGEHLNEQAAWTSVARILLNLDETITKG